MRINSYIRTLDLGHVISAKFLKVSFVASFLVALVLSALSITTAHVSSVFDLLTHPGFWIIYGKSVLWFFVCGVLVSFTTQFIIKRR